MFLLTYQLHPLAEKQRHIFWLIDRKVGKFFDSYRPQVYLKIERGKGKGYFAFHFYTSSPCDQQFSDLEGCHESGSGYYFKSVVFKARALVD